MMFALPNSAASYYPPNVTCSTCKHESSRNNFTWTVEKGGYEICTHCRQELIVEDDDA